MKKIWLILLLPVLAQQSMAQVSGRLVSADSSALAFANVSILTSADSSFVKAAITNENGNYRFENIPAGKYILHASNVGYQPWHSYPFNITAAENNIDMGVQVLKTNNKQLEEVVVRAQKNMFQQRPEGMVVNVESSLMSKGSSALQVLERSPGVVLNYRDNSIALNGKNGVMVMLNGKLVRIPMEQLVAMLNSMSADDIATIELLTTPPAKYDADGSAGLINIVLKKNKKLGSNGAITVTSGYGKAEKGSASINFAHNTQKINVYGAYTFSRNRTYTDMYVASEQHMPFLGGDVAANGWFNSKYASNNHDAGIGVDVKLTSKITAGLNINYNRSRFAGSSFSDVAYNVLPDSLLQFNGINTGANTWNNLVNSVYVEKAIRDGEKLNFSADWLSYKMKDSYNVQSSFVNKYGNQAGYNQVLFSPAQQGDARTSIQVAVLKMDYTKQLRKNVKLETGWKGAYTTSSSLSGIQSLQNGGWTSTDQTSNHIEMKEGIGAGYASVNAQLSPSLSITGGMRYEYSATNMHNVKTGASVVNRTFGAFFPSVFLSKKINDNSELQLSYTKRISRPSYRDLASYVGYSDPTAVYTGNPFLQPSITHNIKLGYSYRSYSFSLLFSRDINAIARYQLTESPARDILYISPQNLAWQNNITLQASVPFTIGKWWTMNYGFTGGPRRYSVDYTKNSFEHSWFGYSANFSETFRLPKNISMEVSGYYNNTTYNGTQQVEGFGVLNAGIKKVLKSNGGSLQLTVSDILMDQKYKVHYGTLTEEAFAIKSYVSVNTESSMFPLVKLTYSRSFGGGIRDQQKQRSGLQDEKSRIGN